MVSVGGIEGGYAYVGPEAAAAARVPEENVTVVTRLECSGTQKPFGDTLPGHAGDRTLHHGDDPGQLPADIFLLARHPEHGRHNPPHGPIHDPGAMKTRLLSNVRAATAIEFALVAPVFVMLIVGIAQLGLVFMASAGLHNAVAQGARRATLFPRPTPAQVSTSVNAAKFGLDPRGLSTPVVNYNTTASPNYADVQMSYTTS
jgi:hypothetical protein